MKKYSIIIPVYNEKDFIEQTLAKVQSLNIENWEKEVIIVDDGSQDGTQEILKLWQEKFKIIFLSKNQGKGAALLAGLAQCQGEIAVIQDADWEYDPKEIPKLLAPIISGQAQVVYGTRMTGNNAVGHWRYYFGNKIIAWLVNLFYGSSLSDVETGHKAFACRLLQAIKLEQTGFGFEVELTAKFLRQQIKIIEVPVKYFPRRFTQGKKISWRDGFEAVWLIIKYRLAKQK
ncbi:MAG: glycosyltransferase family 2 protein [Candidatus Buchananbacteria bacterium]